MTTLDSYLVDPSAPLRLVDSHALGDVLARADHQLAAALGDSDVSRIFIGDYVRAATPLTSSGAVTVVELDGGVDGFRLATIKSIDGAPAAQAKEKDELAPVSVELDVDGDVPLVRAARVNVSRTAMQYRGRGVEVALALIEATVAHALDDALADAAATAAGAAKSSLGDALDAVDSPTAVIGKASHLLPIAQDVRALGVDLVLVPHLAAPLVVSRGVVVALSDAIRLSVDEPSRVGVMHGYARFGRVSVNPSSVAAFTPSKAATP